MRRFEVLHRIAQISDSGGGTLRETLDSVCEIIVPEIADFCVIDLIREGQVERIAVRVGPGGGERAVDGIAGRRPSLPREMEAGEAAPPTGPRFLERIGEAELADLAHDPEDLEFLRGLGMRSAITVALRARGKLTGRADHRRRLVGTALHPRARRVRRRPLRKGGADARERGALLRPGALRRGAGGDRRDASARPPAAAAPPHPGLVGRRLLQARGGRERGRRRLLRRLPGGGRLDARDRRRHRTRGRAPHR